MRWKRFGSKPTKSLAELKTEVDKLKEAEAKTETYQELQKEKERIQKEIKQQGFQIRHRKALSLIHSAENIMGRIEKTAKSKKAKKLYKKYLK